MAASALQKPESASSRYDRDLAIAAVQRWRGHIDTLMHFNEMLMRARGVSVSIVIAVFGGAAVSIAQHPDQLIGGSVHIAAIVIAFGLLLLVAVFVLDYFYYYRMLLAVAAAAEVIEKASLEPNAPIDLQLTCCISSAIAPRRATTVLIVFYGIPFVSGLIFLLYLATIGL